jgi:hypothetical protein
VRLYGRKAVLRVDTRVFEGIDLEFEVDRSDGSDPNKAVIKAFNLSPSGRNHVEASGRVATLSAGYGDSVGVIFSGTITRPQNERSGADIVTTLECSDGERPLRLAGIDLSLLPGATDAQVLERCLAALEAQGVGRGLVAAFPPRAYMGGFAYSGPVRTLLDDLCRRRGLQWGIENGVVEVNRTAVSANLGSDVRAVLLSAETGLIGLPTKKEGLLIARSLLNHGLRPRRWLKLVSTQTRLNGLYVVRKARYVGGTRAGDFVTEIEASLDSSVREA